METNVVQERCIRAFLVQRPLCVRFERTNLCAIVEFLLNEYREGGVDIPVQTHSDLLELTGKTEPASTRDLIVFDLKKWNIIPLLAQNLAPPIVLLETMHAHPLRRPLKQTPENFLQTHGKAISEALEQRIVQKFLGRMGYEIDIPMVEDTPFLAMHIPITRAHKIKWSLEICAFTGSVIMYDEAGAIRHFEFYKDPMHTMHMLVNFIYRMTARTQATAS